MGPIRNPLAGVPITIAMRAPGKGLNAEGLERLQVQMEQTLKALFGRARALLEGEAPIKP